MNMCLWDNVHTYLSLLLGLRGRAFIYINANSYIFIYKIE